MDLLTGPCQSSTLLRQLHPPSGGCPTGQEQSLQHQGVCYWHIATLPRTACFGRDAILRKQELRLCWAVIAPYIWVSPRQATSHSCWTNIQITQAWTLKVLKFCQYPLRGVTVPPVSRLWGCQSAESTLRARISGDVQAETRLRPGWDQSTVGGWAGTKAVGDVQWSDRVQSNVFKTSITQKLTHFYKKSVL